MTINEKVLKAIQISVYSTGLLSILSLLSIISIFFYKLKRKKTTPAFELIFNLCLCELTNTIAVLLIYFPDYTNKDDFDANLCSIQAPLVFFSETAQHLMATIISCFILSINSKANSINANSKLADFLNANENNFDNNSSNKNFNLKNIFKFKFNFFSKSTFKKLNFKSRIIYVLICYGFSALLTLIGIYSEVFGVSKFNCLIREEYKTLIAIYYCAIWLLIFANFIIAVKIFCMKFSFLDETEKTHRLEFSKSLSYYPIITLISFLVFTASNYINNFETEVLIIIGNAVNIVFNLSTGFVYALVCFNSLRFKRKIAKLIRRLSLFSRKSTCAQLNVGDICDSTENTHKVLSNANNRTDSLVDDNNDNNSKCSQCV